MADRCRQRKAKEEPSFSYYAKGHPVITMHGNESLCIENYKKLLSFSPETVRLSTALGCLYVRGKELVIRCFSPIEIEICGHILSVSFCGEEGR